VSREPLDGERPHTVGGTGSEARFDLRQAKLGGNFSRWRLPASNLVLLIFLTWIQKERDGSMFSGVRHSLETLDAAQYYF
jgi:hypothetical protein